MSGIGKMIIDGLVNLAVLWMMLVFIIIVLFWWFIWSVAPTDEELHKQKDEELERLRLELEKCDNESEELRKNLEATGGAQIDPPEGTEDDTLVEEFYRY